MRVPTDEQATVQESLNRARLLGAWFHAPGECRAPGDTDEARIVRAAQEVIRHAQEEERRTRENAGLVGRKHYHAMCPACRAEARAEETSMAVRAKFRVTERTERVYSAGATTKTQESVKLTAVMDEANKTWAKYTPSGSIEMSIDNPAALDQFKPGETFFVDFTPAPATEAEEH